MFRRVLSDVSGDPPRLVRVEIRENVYYNGFDVSAWFARRSGEPEEELQASISRRELMDGPPLRSGRRNGPWAYEAEAIWSRCYEDHYIDRMLVEGDRLATEALGRGRMEDAALIIEQTNALSRTARSNGHRISFESHYRQVVEIDPGILASDVPRHETATEIRLRHDATARRIQREIDRQIGAHSAGTNTIGVAEAMTTQRMLDAMRALGLVPTLGDWQASGIAIRNRFYGGLDVGTPEAQARGLQLLKDNLTPEQRDSYEKNKYFDVKGGESGTTYRIRHGRQMNIDVLDKKGRRKRGICFLPIGSLVAGDCMLAQKTALELYESEALKVANKVR